MGEGGTVEGRCVPLWLPCDTMRRPGFAANRLAFNPGHAIYCKFLNPVEPRFPHIYSDCNNTYYTGYCGN